MIVCVCVCVYKQSRAGVAVGDVKDASIGFQYDFSYWSVDTSDTHFVTQEQVRIYMYIPVCTCMLDNDLNIFFSFHVRTCIMLLVERCLNLYQIHLVFELLHCFSPGVQ